MKIRNAHGVKLSKLVPGCVAVTQFGPVVVKKVRVPKKILRDADYYATANVGPAARVANIRVTIQLFNTVPVIGRLLDPDATIWRTDIAFGSVERILKPNQIEDLEPPFLTVEGKSCCGCGEGCGDDDEDSDVVDHIAQLRKYVDDSLASLNLPVGVTYMVVPTNRAAVALRVFRRSTMLPQVVITVTESGIVHSTPDRGEPVDEPLADTVRKMLQAHASRKGIVPFAFNGKPWVK